MLVKFHNKVENRVYLPETVMQTENKDQEVNGQIEQNIIKNAADVNNSVKIMAK